MRELNTVELIDFVGGDHAHARAAWASTDQEISDETKHRIPGLLRYLALNHHGTPFEHSMFSFRVQSDLATHIHLLKHRTLSINSESARYKELTRDSYYIPEDWPESLQESASNLVQAAQRSYHLFIKDLEAAGLSRARAKESARFLLPYANQLRYVVTFNFRNFVHFYQLRASEHAQIEVKDIAHQMRQLIKNTGQFNESLLAFSL